MLVSWRLGLGPVLNLWPSVGGRLMVLVTRGRRTGRTYHTPLNYAEVDGDIHCLAGFGSGTDWFRNALTHPTVEVWLPDGWWEATAEDVSQSPDRLRLLRAVLIGSGFAAYLAGFKPRSMPDAVLQAKTAEYRLLRLHRTAARTGSGGPGDLSGPVISGLLLYAVVRGRRRPHRPWLPS